MKILMSGMAARGIGSTKTRHKIVSLPDVLGRALRELGHEVDGPRRVREGESLSGVDVVMVQLGWVSSLSSTYAHEAGLLMSVAEKNSIPVIRYVDDWRSAWLADDIQGHVVSEKGWSRHTQKFRAKEYSGFSASVMDDIREAFTKPIRGASLLVPLMRWGDPALFDVSTKARLSRVIPFDPQALCDQIYTPWRDDEERDRAWVVASLQDHDKWVAEQKLSWDVVRLGGTKKNPGGTVIAGGLGGVVVPEEDVLRAYASAWGVLSPEYLSAGSGYWRTRYDQAMGAGALIWPGATDAAAIGGPFREAAPLQVEPLSTLQLGELQAAQASHLDSYKVPKEEALQQLNEVLHAAE